MCYEYCDFFLSSGLVSVLYFSVKNDLFTQIVMEGIIILLDIMRVSKRWLTEVKHRKFNVRGNNMVVRCTN